MLKKRVAKYAQEGIERVGRDESQLERRTILLYASHLYHSKLVYTWQMLTLSFARAMLVIVNFPG